MKEIDEIEEVKLTEKAFRISNKYNETMHRGVKKHFWNISVMSMGSMFKDNLHLVIEKVVFDWSVCYQAVEPTKNKNIEFIY